jgi:hypothetical protein
MIAVFIVASVGSFVDWKKEVQFVKSRMKSNEKNVVSKFSSALAFHSTLPLQSAGLIQVLLDKDLNSFFRLNL